ncbi:hypothetical protein ZIOFF_055630 [Zingiber officinale]|uniref:Uncharacterized protein n=1 Tax=Zingiber officinale TaxID=94328 RepID=A0A8J5FM41_ZINOF|nr:hypothetical protein ZIOFF_055630 [Zingiber officinale]
MLAKGALPDGMRISVSSLPSTSSQGSTQEDFDASEDVYVWGVVISDSSSRASVDKNSIPSTTMADVLLPKPLESNLILGIRQVAVGVRHAALVTKQGEVFTWGKECGGRLGHGVASDSVHPRLVETLTSSAVDYVACGEFHSCAATVSGELYTWGDGTHNTGLLGKPRISCEGKDKFDKMDTSWSKPSSSSNSDLGINSEAKVSIHAFLPRATANSTYNSRVVSTFSRKPSLSRSTTPTPTTAGLSLPKCFIEDAKKNQRSTESRTS